MRKQSIHRQFYLIIFAIFMLLTCFGTGISIAKAETVHTVDEVAESIVFITFKKGSSEDRGNYLGASFFFPKETFEIEYEYGVAVFPEKFIERYELYGDYLARKEAEGISIAVITSSGGQVDNGRLITYNITKIPEKAFNQRLVYVFFVRNAEGEVAYKEPVISSFAETTYEYLSIEELQTMAYKRQKAMELDNSFRTLIIKTAEMTNSIWLYLVIGCSSVVAIWGAYIGIRVLVAKKNEQKIDAKGMMENLLIGIIFAFILAVAAPLLINGLAAIV